MQLSSNYGLKLFEGTDNVKRQDFVDNFTKIDSVMKEHDTHLSDRVYQTAGGSATAMTLTIKGTLVNGYPITFIASANNGGAATTINGKKLYKPGTTTSPNLIAGKAYTVWYNSTGDCFFIKASAEGSALAKDVRKNTTFSNDNDTGIVGGLDLSLLVSGNLRAGVTIDGVTGKSSVVDTADATVVANHMLAGETSYKNGTKITGTAVNQGARTITPGISNQTIAANTLLTDVLTVLGDSDLIAANIVSGKNIFNVVGTTDADPVQTLLPGTATASNAIAKLDTAVSTSSISYSKLHEVQISKPGTVRVGFNMAPNSSSYTAYGIIYINGFARGTERANNASNNYTWFEEDITVNKNDLIQLYLRINASGGTANVHNFGIYVGTVAPVITDWATINS